MAASYADVAASGPSQSPEEANLEIINSRAPAPAEVVNTTDTETSSLVDVDTPHVTSVTSSFTSQRVQTQTQAERIMREFDESVSTAESKAKRAAAKAKRNADNPVVIGNVVVAGVLAALIGTAAYKRMQEGPWSWRVWGGWAAAVAAVGLGDYFGTQALFKRYPPKE